MPEPAFEPVSSGQPKLDCSDVGLDDDQELWLLQLPHDVSSGVGDGICMGLQCVPPCAAAHQSARNTGLPMSSALPLAQHSHRCHLLAAPAVPDACSSQWASLWNGT